MGRVNRWDGVDMDTLITILGWIFFIAILLIFFAIFLFKLSKRTIYKKQFERNYIKDLFIINGLHSEMILNYHFLDELTDEIEHISISTHGVHTKTTLLAFVKNKIFEINNVMEVVDGGVFGDEFEFSDNTLFLLKKYLFISENDYDYIKRLKD